MHKIIFPGKPEKIRSFNSKFGCWFNLNISIFYLTLPYTLILFLGQGRVHLTPAVMTLVKRQIARKGVEERNRHHMVIKDVKEMQVQTPVLRLKR